LAIRVNGEPISISTTNNNNNNNNNLTAESISGKIPKFSIGKDLNQTFPDIQEIVTKLNNSNITDDQFLNQLFNALNISITGDGTQEIGFHGFNNANPSTSTTKVTIEQTETSKATTSEKATSKTTTTTKSVTRPKPVTTPTTKVPTTSTSKSTITTVTTTTATFENVVKKLERAKTKFNSIHKKKDRKGVAQLVDDVLSTTDVGKLNKGRKTDETKAVLNYMMSALYNIKQKKSDFDSNKFFDEVCK
jgi:hypothetical protein